MSDILIILGMHRSGTSYLASILERSGLNIGTQLVENDWSNPAGHFENEEFVKFHINLLHEHGLDFDVTAPVEWKFTQSHYELALALIRQNGCHIPWGWKDPRTCLLLDFWQELLPDAKFIAVYRHYIPVIQSLMTRDCWDYRNSQTKILRPFSRLLFTIGQGRILALHYLKVWMHYNTMLLNLLNSNPESCVLLSFEQLTESNQIPYTVLQEWGLSLQPVQPDPASTFKSVRSFRFPLSLDTSSKVQANKIWAQLCNSIESESHSAPLNV